MDKKMDKKELNKKLEEKLRGIDVPPPDEARKSQAIQAAMDEFAQAREESEASVKEEIKEESKGIADGRRLTGKKRDKKFFLPGGFVMRRRIYATIGIAVVAVFLAVGLYPQYKERAYVSTLNTDIKNSYTAASAYLTDSPKTQVAGQPQEPVDEEIGDRRYAAAKPDTKRQAGYGGDAGAMVGAGSVAADQNKGMRVALNQPMREGDSRIRTRSDDAYKYNIQSNTVRSNEAVAPAEPMKLAFTDRLEESNVRGIVGGEYRDKDAVGKKKAKKIVDPTDPRSSIYLDTSGKLAGTSDSRRPPSVAYQEGKAWRPAALESEGLPRDKFGNVDWGDLVRNDQIAPKGSLDPSNTSETAPLDLDIVIKSEKAKSDDKNRRMALSKVGAVSEKEQVAGYIASSPPVVIHSKVVSDVVRRQQTEYAGRDQFERLEQNQVKLTANEPVSTFSLDVDTTSYSFMRRALNNGYLPQRDSVRIEELINYFDYDYTAPKSLKKPFKPTIAVYPSPWNKANKLIHIGIKGHELDKKKRPRANLVFLLDVSGSMSSRDKLPLLKNSMKMMVKELNQDDTVAIVVYAGAAGTVLPPTKVKDKGLILSALSRLNAGGSTAGGAGIKLAYSLAEANFDKDAVNRVILATDGDFNVGISNKDELKSFVERKRDTGIFLTVLGFGQGNYNDALMQKLAQNGNGNAAYIDTLSEARKVLVTEAGATLFPIAKDVKIQVEFNPKRVAEYRLIGYESRMLNREDFNNDKVDAGDVGAGHSVTAIYEITEVGAASALVDPLRYGKEGKVKRAIESDSDMGGEYAFLKIRYKLPKETRSKLITRAITDRDAHASVEQAGVDIRFAASVAAFGQKLKGSRYTKDFTYDDVRELAAASRGEDRFGYRSEFINLIGLADSADTMGDR